MSVYKKLQQARVELQSVKMSKSGHNKFAGYQYFELGDFLPAVQDIFNRLGLCGVISFTAELATLRIVDADSSEEIGFQSPMAGASLKGCHDIQNLGAVQTYQRRYLYTTAMEIVEHDALDATTKKDTITPTTGAREAIEPIRLSEIKQDAQQIIGLASMQDADTVLAILKDYRDADEKTALWTFLDSKVRSWIKKVSAESIKAAGMPPKGATYVHADLLACIETTDDQEALTEIWTQCKTLYANADDGAGWSEFKAKFTAKAATLKKD
jgi:hypothetical protein